MEFIRDAFAIIGVIMVLAVAGAVVCVRMGCEIEIRFTSHQHREEL